MKTGDQVSKQTSRFIPISNVSVPRSDFLSLAKNETKFARVWIDISSENKLKTCHADDQTAKHVNTV